MSMHARSIAVLAGAVAGEVDIVARIISQAGDVSVEAAKEALKNLPDRLAIR
jgi:hydroxymethylglutaryl-CoA reductase